MYKLTNNILIFSKYILLIISIIFALFPLIWMLSTSIKLPKDYSIKSFQNIIDFQNKLKGKIYSYKKIEEILDEIDEIALKKEDLMIILRDYLQILNAYFLFQPHSFEKLINFLQSYVIVLCFDGM